MSQELRNYMYHHYNNGYISYPYHGSHAGYGHPSNYPLYYPHNVPHSYPHHHPLLHLINYPGTLQFAVPIQTPVL
jgi:hypothetical protein